MRAYRRARGKIDGRMWSVLGPGRDRTVRTHCTAGWVGPTAGRNGFEETVSNSFPDRETCSLVNIVTELRRPHQRHAVAPCNYKYLLEDTRKPTGIRMAGRRTSQCILTSCQQCGKQTTVSPNVCLMCVCVCVCVCVCCIIN